MRAVLVVTCLGSVGCLATWSPCKPDEDSIAAGGGFDSLQCWEDLDANWGADVSVDSSSGTGGEEPALRVDNPFPGESVDDITISQRGGSALMRDTLYVEERATVTVTLWTRSESDGRPFGVRLSTNGSPRIGLFSEDGTAGTSWSMHSFVHDRVEGGDLILTLAAGGPDDTTLWIDDLKMSVVESDGD